MDPSSFVQSCFEKKVLLNKELLNDDSLPEILNKLETSSSSLLVLNKDNFIFLEKDIDWKEFDKLRVALERNHSRNFTISSIQIFNGRSEYQ